jgi:hypothetical protein
LRAVVTLCDNAVRMLLFPLFVSLLAQEVFAADPAKREPERVMLPSCAIRLRDRPDSGCETEAPAFLKVREWVLDSVQVVSGEVIDLNTEKQRLLQRALQAIAMTPSGIKLLDRFLPQLQQGRIRILPLQEYKEQWPYKDLAGLYDYDSGIVYVNTNKPLGIMIPTLFHEIVHALDPDLDRYYHQRQKLEQACAPAMRENCYYKIEKLDAKASFATERKAYSEEWRFVQEMANLNPCYVSYLKSYAQAKPGPEYDSLRYMPDSDILDLYGLPSSARE